MLLVVLQLSASLKVMSNKNYYDIVIVMLCLIKEENHELCEVGPT